jgi:hypothetical protein
LPSATANTEAIHKRCRHPDEGHAYLDEIYPGGRLIAGSALRKALARRVLEREEWVMPYSRS